MAKLKEMLEKRASLFAEVNGLAKRSDLSEEEKVRFTEQADALDVLDADIAFEQRKSKLAQMKAEAIKDDAEREEVSEEEMGKRYETAWHQWLRNKVTVEQRGVLDSQIKLRGQSTTDAEGGYTIPEGFSNMLEKAMAYFYPFSDASLFTVMRTSSGNDMPYPKVNDTSVEGYLVAEGANLETSATDVTFGSQTLSAYKFTSGLVRVSNELLMDSYFNMITILADLFGERMGRGYCTAFTTGTGSGQPQGIVVGSTLGETAAAVAAITRDDILDLIHSVDIAYRNDKSRLMLNDNTLKAIRKLTIGSSDDRPLWQPSMAVGMPATIEGVPYIVNNKMADMGASNKSMIYGDMSKFVIRYSGPTRTVVLRERFADTDEIGMTVLSRIDSQVLNAGTNPIKHLIHPSS